MKFNLGEIYSTPYGISRVVKMHGDCAEFSILELNDTSKSMGWKKGMHFMTHPCDEVVPSVPESYTLIPRAN